MQLQVASITTMIFSHFILHSTVLPSDFIISTSSYQEFIKNQPNDLLSVDLLAQLVRNCIRNADWSRVWNQSSSSLNLWRLSFCNCQNCVYNCNDLLSFNSSPRSFSMWFGQLYRVRTRFWTKISRTFQGLSRTHFPYLKDAIQFKKNINSMSFFSSSTTQAILSRRSFLCLLLFLWSST